MFIRAVTGLMVVVLAVASPASAEPSEPSQPVDQQIPLDIVLRLLNVESAEQLLLGRMPEEMAEQITLPDDVDIIGTVSHSELLSSREHVKAESGRSVPELRQSLIDSLQTAGWRLMEQPGTSGPSGFADATIHRNYLSFCGPTNAEGTILEVVMSGRGDGPTSLNLNRFRSHTGPYCEADPKQAVYSGDDEKSWADDLVPVLTPPEGASSSPRGRRFYDRYIEIRAHVETELPPDALIGHYGEQLVGAGWVVGRPLALSKLAAAEVSLQTHEGETVSGVLVAECRRRTQYLCELSLEVSRERNR